MVISRGAQWQQLVPSESPPRVPLPRSLFPFFLLSLLFLFFLLVFILPLNTLPSSEHLEHLAFSFPVSTLRQPHHPSITRHHTPIHPSHLSSSTQRQHILPPPTSIPVPPSTSRSSLCLPLHALPPYIHFTPWHCKDKVD